MKLTAPHPVPAISTDQASGLVPVSPDTRRELQRKVDAFVADLLSHDPQSPAFGNKATQLGQIGQKEVHALAVQSSRFLGAPGAVMEADGGVGRALVDLRKLVDDLDPGSRMDLLRPRKLLGIIPLGSRLPSYFDRYVSSQEKIQAILAGLARGRDTLLEDNIAIETERAKMWAQMAKLEEMIVITQLLDTALEETSAMLDHRDPAKARGLRESALFEVRGRRGDLLTQMAVSMQGYLALDLIRKNNIELIKGADRASTTTVAALRTAITAAQALANQKLVMARIEALNTAATNAIEAGGTAMRGNNAAIQEQAASAGAQLEELQRAFANVYAAMDDIDQFRLKAYGNMNATIDALAAQNARPSDMTGPAHSFPLNI